MKAQLDAVARTQLVVSFGPDARILSANKLFLDKMEYSIEEIRLQHHKIFVSLEEAGSDEYREFWQDLRQGKERQGTFLRFKKSGQEIYVQATYTPILNQDGIVIQVKNLCMFVSVYVFLSCMIIQIKDYQVCSRCVCGEDAEHEFRGSADCNTQDSNRCGIRHFVNNP